MIKYMMLIMIHKHYMNLL